MKQLFLLLAVLVYPATSVADLVDNGVASGGSASWTESGVTWDVTGPDWSVSGANLQSSTPLATAAPGGSFDVGLGVAASSTTTFTLGAQSFTVCYSVACMSAGQSDGMGLISIAGNFLVDHGAGTYTGTFGGSGFFECFLCTDSGGDPAENANFSFIGSGTYSATVVANPSTNGALTYALTAVDYSFAVPEPGVLSLLVLGLAAAGFTRRRQ